jgi:hypothetical protein
MLRRGETSVPKGAYNPETIAMLRAVLDDAWLRSRPNNRCVRRKFSAMICNVG